MNYQSALEKLGTRSRRKLTNNTYLEKIDDDTIGVRLHSTYVVTFKSNGTAILNSGGWYTRTTKDRINAYAPGQIRQAKGHWYLVDGSEFRDGVVLSEYGVPITINVVISTSGLVCKRVGYTNKLDGVLFPEMAV